jgi:hypothetical protein
MARKNSRKAHRKGSRKANRKGSRKQRGGEAPVNYMEPANGAGQLNLAQGRQFAAYHANQHGGAMNYGPFPGAVLEPSLIPESLVPSAGLLPLTKAFDEIRQFGPQSDNPYAASGGRRKGRKASKKSRKSKRKSSKSRKANRKSRKQSGGDFVRWGGGARKGRKGSRKSRKGSKKNSRKQRGGSYAEMRFPMPVADETKMLIPPALQTQAGLNPEWKLAENPLSFAPKY